MGGSEQQYSQQIHRIRIWNAAVATTAAMVEDMRVGCPVQEPYLHFD